MSVVVKSTRTPHGEPGLTRPNAIRIVSAFVRGLSKVLAAVAALCVIGAFASHFVNNDLYGVACFIEWFLGSSVYAVITGCLGRFLELHEESPLSSSQGRYLRMAAGGFLLLALLGFVCSLLASFLANGSLPLVNIAFPGAGFPDPSTWEQIFSAAVQTPSSTIVSVDMASIVAGFVLWAASFLFDYGAQLQQEKEGTV